MKTEKLTLEAPHANGTKNLDSYISSEQHLADHGFIMTIGRTKDIQRKVLTSLYRTGKEMTREELLKDVKILLLGKTDKFFKGMSELIKKKFIKVNKDSYSLTKIGLYWVKEIQKAILS